MKQYNYKMVLSRLVPVLSRISIVFDSGVVLPCRTPQNDNCEIRDNNNRGFTFIELILYISIVTIMLSSLIPFAWNVIEGGVKSSVEQEVFSQARYISERLKYEIRNANDINSVSAASISFDTSTDPTTVIDLSGGKVRIKYGGSSAIELNSDDTSVTSLTFTDYTSSDNKTKHVGFTLTVTANLPSQRQEFKETITLRSSAEIRSN